MLKITVSSTLLGNWHHRKQKQRRFHVRCNAFRFIQGLLCHPCAIEWDKNGLVGDRICWPVRFSMRVEVEQLDRDTAEKPAMSATQTMCCHCHQGNVVLFLCIRDDLGCRVSIQNLRLYVYPPLIRELPGYVRKVVLRPCHFFVEPVLREFYAHETQRGNGGNDTQQCNPSGECTRKSAGM